jgi:hypothetical protein
MELYHQSNNPGTVTTSATYVSESRLFRYDPANWSGGTFTYYFEVTSNSSPTKAQLYNSTDASAISGSEVSPGGAGWGLYRSGSITMPASAKDMDTQAHSDGTANAQVPSSWLVIDVSGLLTPTPTPIKYSGSMSNSSYILKMGHFNSIAGESTGSNYRLNVNSGETAPGLYSGPSNKVKAGFEYISSTAKFKFTISSQFIDFGTLSATNPVTRIQNLTISNPSAHGYIVTAQENHQLLVPASGALITDTTCDTGLCTDTTAAAWTSNLTYDFGYRCDNVTGTDCVFTTANYYKQFTNLQNSSNPQSVMSGNYGNNKQVQVTYKVNVPAAQAAGLYTNSVTYIATPIF